MIFQKWIHTLNNAVQCLRTINNILITHNYVPFTYELCIALENSKYIIVVQVIILYYIYGVIKIAIEWDMIKCRIL